MVAVFTILSYSTEQTYNVIVNVSLFTFTRSRLAVCYSESVHLTGSKTTGESWFGQEWVWVSVWATNVQEKKNCWHKQVSVCNTHLQPSNILMSQIQTLTHSTSASKRWLTAHTRKREAVLCCVMHRVHSAVQCLSCGRGGGGGRHSIRVETFTQLITAN